jgi:hypothetical protein
VRRVALTWEQVQEHSPPPNPAKESDARFTGYRRLYGTESWELDALEPQVIVQLIRDEIEVLTDEDAWDEVVEQEERERQALREAAATLDGR